MTPFPTEGPFRIDQVTAAPLLMAGLFGCQLAAAAWMSWAGVNGRRRGWWIGAAVLLSLVALFFTLASWGTSDITKLSHGFAIYPGGGTKGEPFWLLVGPLVLALPYRMAAVHGLVAAGYAAAPLLLAWRWRALAWGGWSSLLICCSPLLRSFLQNGVTRQALALLLLLPLMLWSGRLVELRRPLIAVGVLWSALVHSTFPTNLLLSLSPLLLRDRATGTAPGRWRWWLTMGVLAALLIAVAPIAWQKVSVYAARETFFSHYAVLREVQRLQWALALGLALTCWQRHLGVMRLLKCSLSRQLALFSVLFLLIQASVEWEWFPQITFRLADGVGFFLLITYLAWIHRYQAYAYLLPALLVTLHYWLFGRILNTETLACGANDSFLCIPDRWPWEVRY
ncbi:hypothetical protein [Cyanobium sp. Morenito 9A2]|uniref:hypothetical protein n=1 Tax=Cyanobium sp. Morenito 9A2 TaxID=2823718 RepID=UPI0020CD5E7A|nr:hypothetical protein [Cyanobium sp. Morenito 9A2]MCP9849551.1 hypothetical protein [Cyanobium sp. Morenito 9A2]